MGDIVSIGHLNSDAVFLVTNIFGNRSLDFMVDCVLLSTENGLVKDVMSNFQITMGINFISKSVSLKKSSKSSKFVSDLVCGSRSKLSIELNKNDFWYRKQCRTFDLGSSLRVNIRSGMMKMARSSTFNLGKVDMSLDPHLFNLNDCNRFRSIYSIADFVKLDKVIGRGWDLKIRTEGDPNSFF